MERNKGELIVFTKDIKNEMAYENDNNILCGISRDVICSKLLMRQIKHEQEVKTFQEIISDLTTKNELYEDIFNMLIKSIDEGIRNPKILIANFEQDIKNIEEIKYKYYEEDKNKIMIVLLLEKVNHEAENKIYEKYAELLDKYPDKIINLRIMRLWGRNPKDIIDEGLKQW